MGNTLNWTNNAINIRAITETRKRREKRFNEVKARVSNQNEEIRDEILALTFLELKDALQADKYNAQNVLLAYSWKALQVQETHNCLCEFLIESFDEAIELDNFFSNKPEKPPLYGVPFSVKSNFYIKGYDCCIGLAQLLNDPKTDTCTFVTLLRNLGAIPFVNTNVPQALMSFVCSNSVYGTTGNPFDVKRTPGGSSGGDACLTALGGTPFGTGGDLAGSLRIPANFCGVVTLKPSQNRLLLEHANPGVPGRGRLGLSTGFFTKTVEEHRFLLQHVYGNEEYCKLVSQNLPLPFKDHVYEDTAKKILRIGYYFDDGFLKTVPACARVVTETVEKLKEAGHELVHFRLPDPEHIASILNKCILPEGGVYLSNLYNHDIIDPHIQEFATMLKVPKFVRWLVSYAISPFSRQASIIASSYVQSAEDVRVAQSKADQYVSQFTDLFKELKLDALIFPAFPVPPVPHRYPSKLPFCVLSTAIYNLLDYPVGIVKTGNVTEQDDKDLADEAKWPTDYNFLLKFMRDAAANSKGLPLAIQIATLPYQEEKCLGVMKIVETLWANENHA